MQLEVGSVYEGKVTGITKFGAFVELDPKTTGMVHISEVANTFVNEIKDHIQEGQAVKVKVLNIGEDGKISLSIKKALPPEPRQQRNFNREDRPARPNNFQNKSNNYRSGDNNNQTARKQPSQFEPRQAQNQKSGDLSFEDMLSKFKQNSEEKMSDLKHIIDNKRKGASRRGK